MTMMGKSSKIGERQFGKNMRKRGHDDMIMETEEIIQNKSLLFHRRRRDGNSSVASTTLQPFLLERSPTFRYGNEVHCSLVGRLTWLFSSRSSRDSTVTDAVTIPSLVMCSNTSIHLSKASSNTSKLPTRERSKVLVTCVEGSNNQESKRKTTFLSSGDFPHNKGFEVSISFSGASPHSNDNDLQVEDVFSSFCQVTFIRTKFLKQSASPCHGFS